MKGYLVVFILPFIAACGSNSPTTPSAPATKVVGLSGNLAFGNVTIGQSATTALAIANTGNTSLTVSKLGLSGDWETSFAIANRVISFSGFTSGTIAAGASQTLRIEFSPTTLQSYSGTLTVTSDATSGNNTIGMSGTGTVGDLPLFSHNGVGNAVFDMPNYAVRLHVTANYSGSNSSFVAFIGPEGMACVGEDDFCVRIVNEVLGTDQGKTTFEATVATGYQGRVNAKNTISIVSSSSVAWSFTEVR
jgi:hypothetical protein